MGLSNFSLKKIVIASNKRWSGLELLRIISMLMIVSNHLVNHGVLKVLSSNEAYTIWPKGQSINKLFCGFLTCGGRVGVAVFFIISGYFLLDREHLSLKSILNLICKIHFYSFVMLFVFLFSYTFFAYGTEYSISRVIKKSIAIPATMWWFAFAYIILLLLSPSINVLLRTMNRRIYILLLILYVWRFFYVPGNSEYAYYDFIKAVFFYLVGAFIHLLDDDNEVGIISRKRVVCITIACFACWFISGFLSYNSISSNADNKSLSLIISNSSAIINNVLIPIHAILLVFLFKNFIFVNEIINKIASCVFGVYLFHDYPYTRVLIWNRILKVDKVFIDSKCFPILVVIVSFCLTLQR